MPGIPPAGRVKRVLEESVPPIPSPKRELEQYTTPAEIAVKIALDARLRGILEGAVVADLACGTCRLAVATLMLGASKAAAVDADYRLSSYCLEGARKLGLEHAIVFINSVVSPLLGPLGRGSVDMVVTNPPFGVWRRGADWEVLGYALSLGAEAVYAILKSGNFDFHSEKAGSLGYDTILISKERFPIPATMLHHRSRVRRVLVDVVLFRKK